MTPPGRTNLLAGSRDFVSRHRWSLSLTGLSAFCFVRLADEMREGDVDALDKVLEGAVDALRGSLDGLMLALTRTGDPASMAVIALALTSALVATRKRREAIYFVTAASGGLILNLLLKAVFHRARPGPDLDYWLPTPSGFSFPSGHAMGSAAVLGSAVIILFAQPVGARWKVVGASVAGLLCLGICTSRVYFGVHYPSDVVGGALAAAAWVSAITGWIYPYALRGEHAKEPLPPV